MMIMVIMKSIITINNFRFHASGHSGLVGHTLIRYRKNIFVNFVLKGNENEHNFANKIFFHWSEGMSTRSSVPTTEKWRRRNSNTLNIKSSILTYRQKNYQQKHILNLLLVLIIFIYVNVS